MKNNSPRRNEVDDEVEEGPIDPRQGKFPVDAYVNVR
jgi:hypothetical protein